MAISNWFVLLAGLTRLELAISASTVDPARFERATSTFAESRSDSTELQVRRNWYGHPLKGVSDPSILEPNLPAARSTIRTQATAETERFERSQDFSRHLSGVLPYQLGDISKWRKARESNPKRTKPSQFSRLLDSLYCRAFRKDWQ